MHPKPSNLDTKAEERSIYWVSFIIRAFLGLLAWWATKYTDLSLVNDAALYESVGATIAKEWLAGGHSETLEIMMESGRHAWVMVVVLAAFSLILGGMRVLPLIIVLYNLLTAWTPVFTYRIAQHLGVSHRGALSATRLVMFSPVFAFWAGALYKEGLILLVLNMIVYHVLLLQASIQTRSIIIIGACMSVLMGLRFYMAGLLIPSIAIGLLLSRRKTSLEKSGEYVAPGALLLRKSYILAVLMVFLVTMGFNTRLKQILPHDSYDFLQQVHLSRKDLAGTASGYSYWTDVSTPEAALKFLPVGILYFLTVPFPWEFGSLRQNLVIPEMIFWLFQYPLILLGMKLGLRRNFQGSIILVMMTSAMVCFYALFIGNAGTAYRLRSQIWLFWALFAGWSKDRHTEASETFTL